MKLMQKSAVIVTILTLSALALAACGTSKPPQYLGGGNGGGSSTSTTLGASNPSVDSVTWVAAQYVAINWSLNPTWPDPNYFYVLERPYVTPAMNTTDNAQAARPVSASVTAKWHQDVKFKVGSYALVSASWIVQDAGVTPTTCIVEVDFLLGTTTDGTENPTVGSVNTYAFRMQKIGGTWFVASGPQQPE
jgi:hypothetical protein